MPKSQDLFDDSTMSFGEHLEILRVHLWKAIIGLALCVIITLFAGDKIINVVRSPIDRALQDFGITAEDDVEGFDFIDWLKGATFGKGLPTNGSGITDDAVKSLGKMPKIKQVNFHSSALTADALRKLKKSHPQLEVSFNPLDVVGLGHLKHSGVRCELNDNYEAVGLSLRGTELEIDELDLAKNFTKLERLDLQGLEIDDDGLAFLKQLPELKFLNLSGTQLTDDGLQHLASLKKLKRLDLRDTQIEDDGLQALSALTLLERLDLRHTKITDAGLAHVGKLTGLEELFVSGGDITDEGLIHLKGLKSLRELEFKETAVTNAGLEHLESLANLEVLNFTRGPITADPFAESLSPEMMESYTIPVRIRASQLLRSLHQIDPETYPVPSEEFEDRLITMPMSAPEFAEFKTTAENARKPVTLNVQEAFLTYLKVAFVSGLVLASPWVFYQLWLFVAAGLYPHERKYVYIYLPMSSVLFVGGAVFCFFAVFPFVLQFLLGFNEWMGVQPQIRLSEWISFAIMLPLMFGLAFQLPLVMLFLERISVFDAAGYREKRRMAILVIAILSMFLTPADPMSMLLMMFPLIILYEFGIMLCSYSPAKSPFETEAA